MPEREAENKPSPPIIHNLGSLFLCVEGRLFINNAQPVMFSYRHRACFIQAAINVTTLSVT